MAPVALAADLPPAGVSAVSSASEDLPDAPQAAGSAKPALQGQGTMSGTVTDVNGGVVPQASVTLENAATGEKRVTSADADGFFRFDAVPPGRYAVRISASGFSNLGLTDIAMHAGQDLDLPHLALPVASATTDVRVVFSQHELAAEQVKAEEKQRVLGIVPSFYTSYVWNAEPLSAGQKFGLGLRSSTDPLLFVATGFVAGIEQWRNTYRGYGQGAEGYGKRYGSGLADRVSGIMIGNALLPVLFRQDPRYFYKGVGSKRSRVYYAATRAFIARGDNGKWEPNYSNVLGEFASGAISTLYYPAPDNDAGTAARNAGIGIGFSALDGVLREFLWPALTKGRPAPTKP